MLPTAGMSFITGSIFSILPEEAVLVSGPAGRIYRGPAISRFQLRMVRQTPARYSFSHWRFVRISSLAMISAAVRLLKHILYIAASSCSRFLTAFGVRIIPGIRSQVGFVQHHFAKFFPFALIL